MRKARDATVITGALQANYQNQEVRHLAHLTATGSSPLTLPVEPDQLVVFGLRRGCQLYALNCRNAPLPVIFAALRSSSDDLAPAALLHQIRVPSKKIEAGAIG